MKSKGEQHNNPGVWWHLFLVLSFPPPGVKPGPGGHE